MAFVSFLTMVSTLRSLFGLGSYLVLKFWFNYFIINLLVTLLVNFSWQCSSAWIYAIQFTYFKVGDRAPADMSKLQALHFRFTFLFVFFFHLPFCIYSFADFLVIIQINLFFLRGCKLKNVLLRFVCFGFLVFRRYPLGAHQSAQPSGVKCVATNAPEKGRLRLRLRKSNKYAACLWSSSNLC